MYLIGHRKRMLRRISLIATCAATGLAASLAVAQTNGAERYSSAGDLRLPEQFTLFGSRDPNIRRPTAIVNGEIITQTDVDQRLALVIASNSGASISDEERQQLRMQVLRNLIDETLQIQEAAANEIQIAPTELDQAYTQVASRFAPETDDFEQFLRQQGSSDRSIKRQIEGEMAWDRLLRREVNPRVNISELQVTRTIEQMDATRGQTEYRIAEIFLPATPDTEQEVYATAQRIGEQIRQGGSFPVYARQYSKASTAAVGGDLGWVRASQLPSELAAAVVQIPVGSLSTPIPLPGGFSLIAVADERQILTADPRDAVLSLKQITLAFPEGTTPEQAEPLVTQLGTATQQGGGCGTAEAVAAQVGGDIVQNDRVPVRDLPPELAQLMVNLQVGEATPPFGSLEQGVRVLVLCGRDDPAPVADVDPQAVEQRLEAEVVNRQANSYLRDLRRNAVIEYR